MPDRTDQADQTDRSDWSDECGENEKEKENDYGGGHAPYRFSHQMLPLSAVAKPTQAT